jgi:nucleotide-binding universal stress UspA family protein
MAAAGAAKLASTAATWVNESNTAHIEELTDVVQRTRVALSSESLELSTDVLKGSPQRVLCDEAHKFSADCIVVGSSSNRGNVGHFREQSVAVALVTTAPCSVEIVRE